MPSMPLGRSLSDLDVDDAPGRSINPSDAKNRIGRRMTVCGVVASANYDAALRRRLTFLNLDEPHPRQLFTAVIWGQDREKFGTPEITLKEKRICVSGLIEEYHGVPQIVLREADQLSEEVD
jgi:DNA/RNA endonuclease YhcR with UshA esterase domain